MILKVKQMIFVSLKCFLEYDQHFERFRRDRGVPCLWRYRAFRILPQICTANHTIVSIQMYAITVQICGNF